MKLSDEELTRLGIVARGGFHGPTGGWTGVVRAILAEIPEPQAPEWATPQVLKFLQSGRLMTHAQIINSGNYHFSCRKNSEPAPLAWATPEAKAVLDSLLPENWDPMTGSQWLALRQAYIASLKPKTRVLPERWIGERQGGFAIFDTQFAADAWAASCDGYIRRIPSQTVEDK